MNLQIAGTPLDVPGFSLWILDFSSITDLQALEALHRAASPISFISVVHSVQANGLIMAYTNSVVYEVQMVWYRSGASK